LKNIPSRKFPINYPGETCLPRTRCQYGGGGGHAGGGSTTGGIEEKIGLAPPATRASVGGASVAAARNISCAYERRFLSFLATRPRGVGSGSSRAEEGSAARESAAARKQAHAILFVDLSTTDCSRRKVPAIIE